MLCGSLIGIGGANRIETQSIEELQRMLSRFRANNFSICDELLLELGAGCFPLGAMVNHSCAPTCAVTSVPSCRPSVSSRLLDIALPRRERQQRLQHKYHFDCSCSRCSRPLEDPESLDAFLDADIDGISQEKWSTERREGLERALQEVSEATGRAASASNPVDQQKQHIEALKQLMERQSRLLHPENIELLKTCSALFSAEMERGGVAEAVGHGERMLQFYRHVYSRNHPMTGLHLFTLGDLQAQLAQAAAGDAARQKKATEYLTEARRILQITHGKSHRFVEMLARRLQDGAEP
ncbi:hypothetical protein BBJ28_00022128 [Nothophytophthora sp. Chile5]|nr:hypothetical protein BBJ28_00022128 [Nothophytophthora sp. Chile5]